ncbi:hypothetical protein Q7F05_08210 [Pseudomonas sp. Lb2C1-1]|uniref:hypothetical protein n=1 Tax=Pseudomonas TaxID=286 RepID=UPI00391CD20A
MALPSLTACEILAAGGDLIDYDRLHHLVAVLGIELERLLVENERSLRLGSELLDALIQSRLPEQAALDRLEQLNCPAEQPSLASARPTTEPVIDWRQRLRRLGVDGAESRERVDRVAGQWWKYTSTPGSIEMQHWG